MIFTSYSISVYRLKIINCNQIDPKLPTQHIGRNIYLITYGQFIYLKIILTF